MTTAYTTLRVNTRGVVLFEAHAERLGPLVRSDFEQFAASANEGVYSLRADGSTLSIQPRSGTRLTADADVREAVSPMLEHKGAFAKPAPPSAYDSVRSLGIMTLLTSAEGDEIFESCLASVMAWDGQSLVLVPSNRPRVMSVAERFVARDFPHRRAPIRTDGDWGLLLINAVAAVVPAWLPGRKRFSSELLAQIKAAIEATAIR